jgi:hypothetical protein
MTSAKNNSPEPSNVMTQYETLRSAALGDALPPEARAGLMLFLRRGLWGWARVMAHNECMAAAKRVSAIQLEGARGIQNRDSHLCSNGD